jgi:hypothetical protein
MAICYLGDLKLVDAGIAASFLARWMKALGSLAA